MPQPVVRLVKRSVDLTPEMWAWLAAKGTKNERTASAEIRLLVRQAMSKEHASD